MYIYCYNGLCLFYDRYGMNIDFLILSVCNMEVFLLNFYKIFFGDYCSKCIDYLMRVLVCFYVWLFF